MLRIEPGEKDLKNAAPLQLQDLQPGDRILVRGSNGPDGKSLLAVSVVAMKKADLAEKHAHEREEWQKHGVGGLVSAIDPATGAVTISTSALGANKSVTVHISKDTVLRRYAPGSVKFDDATPAPLRPDQSGRPASRARLSQRRRRRPDCRRGRFRIVPQHRGHYRFD